MENAVVSDGRAFPFVSIDLFLGSAVNMQLAWIVIERYNENLSF